MIDFRDVPIQLIEQVEYALVGYQCFYEGGHNEYCQLVENINHGTVSNPLIEIRQVGVLREHVNKCDQTNGWMQTKTWQQPTIRINKTFGEKDET